jgi:DNA-binding transcriptional ArsR family regulator
MNRSQKQQFSDDTLQLVASRFKVLSEPMRLRLLNILRSGEKTVSELVRESGAGQANVSKHLSVLAAAGIVARRKEGLNAYYYIADQMIFSLCDLVCSSLREKAVARAKMFR